MEPMKLCKHACFKKYGDSEA